MMVCISNNKGFTMVEVVIALAILSIGIFVLIACTANCLSIIRTSRNFQTARMTLQKGEMEYPLIWSNSADDNAVAPVQYPNGYTFSRVLEPLDGEEKFYLVRTRVAWSEKGQDSFEEVTGILYDPSQE